MWRRIRNRQTLTTACRIGYLAMGNKEEALKHALKAIEMLDIDTNATPEFKQLVRESAEKKIKELQARK